MIALLLLASCGFQSQGGAEGPVATSKTSDADTVAYAEEAEAMADDMAVGGAMRPSPKPMARMAPSPSPVAMEPDPMDGRLSGNAAPADNEAAGPDLRSWFPESFLWQPIVETDDSGSATVDVAVPDTLTTWRVLALAHTRDGKQAGAVHTFDSRMPLYVDPVTPGWLYSGDTVQLPVQVVNTTSDRVEAVLDVSSAGAVTGQGVTRVILGPNGSDVRRVPMRATGSGPSTVRATLGDADAAERQIPVFPTGRPVTDTRGGTVTSTRTFSLNGPRQADPATQELTILVFAGPLAVLQAEIERAAGAGVAPTDAAYSFALASGLEDLSNKAGIDVDDKTARKLRVLAWQRVVRHSRSPDAGTAADLLAAMRDVGGHELAESLRERLVRTVVSGQRGDGTWARQSTAPLQQVLAQTAFAARTLPEDEEGARLRASGALERFAREIEDPYTAAVALASGVVDGDLRADLLEIVVDATSTNDAGERVVKVPAGVRNPWGTAPSRAEVLAWTALALAGSDVEWRGDLVSQLMSGYDAGWGFGAGPADVLALEAVLTQLPGLDQPVTVSLTLDGVQVATHHLDPSQPKVPAVLAARPRAGDPELGLTVTPEVPGLAFVATLSSWVPWSGDESVSGVDVEVEAKGFQVGLDGTVTVTLSAPSGVSLVVEQGLPAGASVDEAGLAALSGDVVEHQVFTDRVRLRTRAFRAGEVMELPITVRPAFAGTFETLPLTIRTSAAGTPVYLPPMRWTVAAEGTVASL